jgi:hypothetical protein
MERIRRTDVDSTDDVTKVINRIIDHINEVDDYNKVVELYNDQVIVEEKEGN